MNPKTNWLRVRKDLPCPICQHTDWCMVAADGSAALCARIEQGATTKTKGGWVHRLTESAKCAFTRQLHRNNGKRSSYSERPTDRDWAAEAVRMRAAMTEECMAALSAATNVPAAACAHLSPGWAAVDDLRTLKAGGARWANDRPDGAWAFPEHSGDGHIVGLSLRAVDGRKGAFAGAKRGLIVPSNLHQLPDPVLIVEGASDVAACCALGLAAVGRPSNRSGADDAAVMLDGRGVLVVGERDGKPDGAWPGRDGAKAVAQQLAGRWGEPVRWTLPPLNAKDARDWLRAELANGLDANDAAAMRAAGAKFLEALQAAVREAKPER
jgi:hypothetical protein